MLEHEELTTTATLYGVSEEQVRRDHLISHILAGLAKLDQPVVFFGGTALARTHLNHPDIGGRLSEDIDLLAINRTEVARVFDQQLPRLLRREFPGLAYDPHSRTPRLSSRAGWSPKKASACESSYSTVLLTVNSLSSPPSYVP